MKILKSACPECGSDMILKNSRYGLFYGCVRYPDCKATHGAHSNSGEPLGVPANEETKRWRIEAHNEFDKLWRKFGYKRKEAYILLQNIMGMTRKEAMYKPIKFSKIKEFTK